MTPTSGPQSTSQSTLSSALFRIILAVTIGGVVVSIMREYGKLVDRLSTIAERTVGHTRAHAEQMIGGNAEIEQPHDPASKGHSIVNADNTGGRFDGPAPFDNDDFFDPFSDRNLLDESDAFPEFRRDA